MVAQTDSDSNIIPSINNWNPINCYFFNNEQVIIDKVIIIVGGGGGGGGGSSRKRPIRCKKKKIPH